MRKTILLFIIGILIFLTACSDNSNNPVEKYEFHMGTTISERIYGRNAEKAASEVMEKIAELESVMTINAAGSEIDELNAQAGKREVKLGKDSMYVINKAVEYAGLSEGTFDVTIGPLVKGWGVFTDNPRIPEQSEIDNFRSLINYKDITLNNENSSAKLARPGQIVDLGGIAKGYAGDEAIKILKKNGIKSGLVNLGGNVVVLGSKPDGSAWKVGVQNPRAETGKYIGILSVKDKAIVSSGDYERFFERDGVRYHHILDPRTGYPADSGLIGTTIIADNSIDADALSTSTFVLGLEKGMKLVESLKGVEAIFITEDKKVYTTSGVKDIFEFDDISQEYEYVEKR